MRVLLVVPMTPYSIIMKKCEMKSLEYPLLKNGIVQHPEGGDEVHFLCTDKQAEAIFDFVARVAPEHLGKVHMQPDI